MKATDFTKLEHGPYGTRWSYTFDADCDSAPSVEQVERILQVKLSPKTHDASGERTDGLCEVVYFEADEFSENTLATYQVQ